MNTIINRWMKLADERIAANAWTEAEDLLLCVLLEEPGHPIAHNNIGWIYLYHLVHLEKARLHLEYALHFDPGLTSAYVHLTEYYNRTGDRTRAIEYIDRALRSREPDTAYLLYIKGQMLELLEEYAEATRVYKTGLKMTTIDWQVNYLNNGISRVRKKRLAQMLPF